MHGRSAAIRLRSLQRAALALISTLAALAAPLDITGRHGPVLMTAHAGSAVVGGRRMTCAVARVEYSSATPAVAFAQRGRIVLNRRLLSRFPAITQRMIFLHECAHQYVGYNETAADCWAIRAGVRQGWLGSSGIKQFCRSIYGTVGTAFHLPGPARCEAMKRCFRNATRQSPRPRRTARRRPR